ncbi:EAL domain-containing protein [Pseudoalteromonas mariniglutinosa]|uniref:EAL domain-containing protein n=1 Tax=Pseudoalteromonas mariniglutinosa TaxID=206042 RepID=UPI00384B15AE
MLKGIVKAGWLLCGFAVFLTSLLCYVYYTYQSTYRDIMADVDAKLLNAAVSVKHILGDHYHQRLNAGLVINSSEYAVKSQALSDYANAMDIAYVYAMVLQDGQVRFSASSYTRSDQGSGKVTQLLDLYPEATEQNKRAFYSTEPVFEISKDQWGHFRSIFVPYVDENGVTYLTGADITIDNLNTQLQQSVTQAAITASFFFFIAMLVTAIYFFQFKRAISNDVSSGFANHTALEYQISKTLKHRMELAVICVNEIDDINSFYGSKVANKVMINLLQHFESNLAQQGKVFRLATNKIALLRTLKTTKEDPFTDLINSFNLSVPALTEPFIYITFHAGIAAGNKQLIIENAHIALQQAKLSSQRLVHYDTVFKEVEQQFKLNVSLAKDVKEAFDNNRIVPYFQAIFNNKTKQIVHYECLARMVTQQGKILVPEQFLAVLKRSRMDSLLTRTMFTHCIKKFRKTDICWSLNITASDILDPSLSEFLEQQLRRYPKPHNIIFEFHGTEAIAHFSEIKTFIALLKNKGAKVMLNEFGAGYSNLSNILKFEVDGIKLDSQLVSQVHDSKDSFMFIEHINNYAHQLNLAVIAEHVESKHIAEALAKAGITLMQGNFFAAPAPYITPLD